MLDGCSVGTLDEGVNVGDVDRAEDGIGVGAYDENGVGESEGSTVGDGVTDGRDVEGSTVGDGVTDGWGMAGNSVGPCDGERVGWRVGGPEVFVERNLRRPSVEGNSPGSIVVAASRYGASASHSKPRSAFHSPGSQGVADAVRLLVLAPTKI